MKDRSKAKTRLALRSRDIHVGWIVGVGVSTAIFLLATFATAYRHDVYSSSLGLRDLVSTDVWFRVFLALTCFSLLLFLGLLVYAFIASILRKDRYFRRVFNSFTDWCCTLFKCLYLEAPKRENIKNPQEISNQVKKRFYYLL